MTDPTQLSPAAQAVVQALNETSWDWASMEQASPQTIAAATLRAAADQVVPVGPAPGAASLKEFERWYVKRFVRMQLLAIADELEAQ